MNGRNGGEPAAGVPAPGVPARLPLSASLGGGLAAAGVAWAVMHLMRATFQVRTLPERLLEWLLLFVSLDLFEAGLRRFGFAAKQYALAGMEVVLFVLLTALGALALRRRWSGKALGALGLGLWLFTMAVIMPLTGAGLFAVDLLQGTGAAVAGYLTVALAYAGALATAEALAEAATGSRGTAASRASAAVLVGSAVTGWACTPLVARWSPLPSLPAAVVPPLPPGQEAVPPSSPSPPAARSPTAAPESAGARSAAPVGPPPAGGATAQGPQDPQDPWNTTNLDAATNGNVARAADLVAASGVPVPVTASATDGAPGPPWRDIGTVHEYTGTIDRLRAYPPGEAAPPWPISRGSSVGEVVLAGSVESGRMPVVCLTLAGTGTDTDGLQEGDQVRARGYLVGVADAENRTDGSTTGLVIVGEVTRR